MLCLLVGVFFILGTRGQTPDQYRCNLPIADIPNGKVELLNYQLVEDKRIFSDINFPPKVFAYAGRVRCDPGFFQVGGSLLDCTDGVTMKLPECLPVPSCKKSLDDPNMLSCGVGYDYVEAQCTIPNEGIEGFGATSRPLECGRIRSGSLVVNGAPAKHGDVPWHVGIYSKMTQPYMQTCGGTLVRNNVVISAAHCFWSDIEKKLPAENYAVAAGKIYRPWNNANDTDYATKSDVREIRIPPRYRGGATNFQDDLAVLLLTTPLQIDNINVVLACLDFGNTLDEKQLQDTNIGMVAGWGLTGADGPASQILNVVKLPIVDIDQCINGAEPSFLSSITSDKICAGFTNGTTVCRGDSGGGLALPEYDIQGPKYYLRGIVSTAPKSDHLCNIYAVATFTHVAKHRHFINAAILSAPDTGTAPVSPSIGIVAEPAPPSIQLTNPLNANGNIDRNTDGNISPSIGVVAEPAPSTVQLTDPLNANGNIDRNTDGNISPSIGVVAKPAASVLLTDPLNTDENLDKNTDGNINGNKFGSTDSGIRPVKVGGGSSLLSANNSSKEVYTLAYFPKTEEEPKQYCRDSLDDFIRRCYLTLSDFAGNIDPTIKKCTTVCRGDSGGGLALPEYDIQGPKYYLRGIVSTAPKSDHLCNIYAVATFTHIAKHEFFIKAALNDAPVIMETETFFSGVIEDDSTTRSSNESVNEPTDKPPVNPLNTNTNPAINSNVTDGIGNRSNNTDSSDINTEGNLSLNFGENTPTDKPTRRPGDKPISQKPSINTDNSPAVNPEVKPDISGVISNKYNKTDTLDLNTAITNAPPTENIWNINKPISNQEIINNTKDEDSITPSPVQGTLVTEPTASVLKPIVSDLLPINLDRNPDKPITGNIDQKPVSPVSSVSGDSPPDASDPKPVVPSDSGLVNQNPGSVQGSVPNKPAFDYIPPHHHQNHPDYNDWQYWHNNHQNWHNHHHNCHEHGHDYHQNWDNHQNWHNHHQDWQNYRNDWQNGPNTQQNWQTYYQNAQYNHQHLPNYDQNEYNKYQQNWHNYLVKSWQSKPLGYDSDVNQQSMPAANKNGYSGYGK